MIGNFLRPFQSTLEFDLRLQEFIELARAQKRAEAILYSQKHFPAWQETHLPQIQQASALLAFSPTTRCAPYKVRDDAALHSRLLIHF